MPFNKSMLVLAIVLFALFVGHALAAGLENVQFLKISPQDRKAVMKTPEGSLRLVGEGDIIAENAKVIEIAKGRVVLEQVAGEELETVIVRVDGRHQRIERVRKAGIKPSVGPKR